MFPSFSLDFLMGLEEETFYYWYRRALEQKTNKEIPEKEDIKIDDEAFKLSEKRLREKLALIEKQKEGIIT